MAAIRRILSRDELFPMQRHERAIDPRNTCERTIKLDGTAYRCGREVYGIDRAHDGIHDAFAVHTDSGEVRW